MADELQLSALLLEVVIEEENPPSLIAGLYSEVIHRTSDYFPLQFTNFYCETTHQTHDVYETHFGRVGVEVIRSIYDASFPPFLDALPDDSEIFAPTIPLGVPKFTTKNVERNPYAAHVPDTAEEVVEHQAEQQKILRDQHNKTQAGDTTFDWGLLLKPYPTKEYTLGSLGRFYHPDFGMILARFCQMTDFVESSFQGQPVGRRRTTRNTTVDWLVTNDYDKSGSDLAMGLVFFATKPDDLTYGWVVVNGANPTVIQQLGVDKPAQAQGYGWAESNRLSPDASGPTLLRVWGNSPLGRIEAGFGFIEVERWSLPAMRALIVAQTQAVVDGLAALSTRVDGIGAQGKTNAASIKAANEVIATLKKALDREILTRQRQIDALRASASGSENDPNVQLRQDLEKRIADGDRSLAAKIGANERAIADLQKAIQGLNVESITEQLDNLARIQGFMSSQYASLLQPTTTGLTLVSAVVDTNEDGSDRLGFIQVNFKLSNLLDVDTVTTPPEDGQALIWDLASEKWIPGDVASGGGDGGGGDGPIEAEPLRMVMRYWRIHIATDAAPGEFMAVGELRWKDEDGVNQVGAGTPLSSADYNGTYAKAKAYDGLTGNDNGWISPSNTRPSSWLGYDFGTEVDIRGVSIAPVNNFKNEGQWPDRFLIQCSNDKITWYTTQVVQTVAPTNDVYQDFAVGEWTNPYALGLTGGSGGGSSRKIPAMVQFATLALDGPIALPALPTVGNMMILVTSGFGIYNYVPPGFAPVQTYQSNGNNLVMCWSRKVQLGDTGSYSLSVSDNQQAILYEYEDCAGVVALGGGVLATSGTNGVIGVNPSPFGESEKFVAFTHDTTSAVAFTPAADLIIDFTRNAGGNHVGAFGRFTEDAGAVACTVSGGWEQPAFGVYAPIGPLA